MILAQRLKQVLREMNTTMNQEVKFAKIKCHQGCLCCDCENKNEDDNLQKRFSDTVMCIQENGKCVDIKRVVYWEDII